MWHTYALQRAAMDLAALAQPPVAPPLPPDDLRAALPRQAQARLAHLPASTAFVAWTAARRGRSAAWLTRHLDISAADAAAICELAHAPADDATTVR
jgi:hypothetical protein